MYNMYMNDGVDMYLNPGGGLITEPLNLLLLGDSITAQHILSTKYPVGYLTGISKANPGVVTATGHPFVTGDDVYHWGIKGMTELNETFDTITKIDANTYSIRDTSAMSTYTSIGKMFSLAGTSHGKSMTGCWTRALQIMRQRFKQDMRWNRGISSEKLTDMAARKIVSIPSGKGVNIVGLMGGTNDANSSLSISTYEAALDEIIQYVTVTLGYRMIILTPPPVDSNSAAQKDIKQAQVAACLARASSRVTVVDTYTACVEPATRNWKAGYSSDGTHPNSLGAEMMAVAIANALVPLFGYGAGVVSNANLLNPMLTGTGGVPTGLLSTGFATDWTTTIFGAMTNKGTLYKDANDVQHVAINFAGGEATNSGFSIVQNKSAGFSVGEWYECACEYKLNSWSGTGYLLELSGGATTVGTARSYVDAGVISGSPVAALPAAEIVAQSAKQSLVAVSHPFRIETGMTQIKPRVQMRFNPSVGPIVADLSIIGFELRKLPANPYS